MAARRNLTPFFDNSHMIRLLRQFARLTRRTDGLIIVLGLLLTYLLIQLYGSGLQAAVNEQLAPPAAAEAPRDQEAEPAAARGVPRGEAAVRFLMYNTQNYFVEADVARSQHTRRIKTLQERELVADTVAEVRPDVVGLVEMGGPAALDDLAERLAKRGLVYKHRRVLTRWGEDRALAILSRYPIVEDHSQAECRLVGQTNRRMLRGILDVTISAPGKKSERRFRIVGVHLKSRVGDNPSAAQALRAREARTLVEHVQQVMQRKPNEPLLIFGDWNDGPGDAALSVMTQPRGSRFTLRRLSPVDSRGEGWTLYYKNGNEYCTFDQIYVNSELSRRMGRKSEMGVISNEKRRGASDHRAVWCDMR